MNDPNTTEILPRFFHRSSREAKEVVAEIAPHPAPPKREVVTALRSVTREPATMVDRRIEETQLAVQALGRTNTHSACATLPDCVPVQEERICREEVEPLTANLRRFHVTVS